jgi:hypothetical protein
MEFKQIKLKFKVIFYLYWKIKILLME